MKQRVREPIFQVVPAQGQASVRGNVRVADRVSFDWCFIKPTLIPTYTPISLFLNPILRFLDLRVFIFPRTSFFLFTQRSYTNPLCVSETLVCV